jgi:hypothetical protein
VAVGVGLHHCRQVRSAGAPLEAADVVADGVEVYLGPGATGGAHAGDRGIQGSLPAGVEDVEVQDVHAGASFTLDGTSRMPRGQCTVMCPVQHFVIML